MSKKNSKRKPAPTLTQSSFQKPPSISPAAFGPPAPVIPPSDGLALRLSADGTMFLISLPNGGQSEISITNPDAAFFLSQILKRVRADFRADRAELAKPICKWPQGTKALFIPPNPSEFRDQPWFGFADTCPVEIQCETVQGLLRFTAPDGKTYAARERYFRVAGSATQLAGIGPAKAVQPKVAKTILDKEAFLANLLSSLRSSN